MKKKAVVAGTLGDAIGDLQRLRIGRDAAGGRSGTKKRRIVAEDQTLAEAVGDLQRLRSFQAAQWLVALMPVALLAVLLLALHRRRPRPVETTHDTGQITLLLALAARDRLRKERARVRAHEPLPT